MAATNFVCYVWFIDSVGHCTCEFAFLVSKYYFTDLWKSRD